MNRTGTADSENVGRIFKRELFTSFCTYYFPLLILMSTVVLSVDYLKQNIGFTYLVLCLLFPAIASVAMAFVRLKIVWGLEYRSTFFSIAYLASLLWFVLLKEEVDRSAVAKMLILASTFFIFIWFVFAECFLNTSSILAANLFLPKLYLAPFRCNYGAYVI
jgi:hypothetical protein